VLIEFGGWVCPLTQLENYLRERGGAQGYQGQFIEHHVLPLLYPSNMTDRTGRVRLRHQRPCVHASASQAAGRELVGAGERVHGRTDAVRDGESGPAGSKYLERWSEIDLSIRKVFTLGRYRVDGALDMFNAFNSNVVLSENQTFGSTLGQPLAVLQGGCCGSRARSNSR